MSWSRLRHSEPNRFTKTCKGFRRPNQKQTATIEFVRGKRACWWLVIVPQHETRRKAETIRYASGLAPSGSLLVNPVDEAFFFQFHDDTVVDNFTELERRARFARQRLFDLNLHSFPGRQRHASGIGRKPTARNFHLLRILKTSQ